MPVLRELQFLTSSTTLEERYILVRNTQDLAETRLGAIGFGFLVDIIGRKWAFNLTCLITSVIGLLMVSLALRFASLYLDTCNLAHVGVR